MANYYSSYIYYSHYYQLKLNHHYSSLKLNIRKQSEQFSTNPSFLLIFFDDAL